jgi:uncharacterized OB-fold protein
MSTPVKLSVLRCRTCGILDPGPREICAACAGSELDPHVVEGTGKLVTWTVIRRAPTRFKDEAPYTVAVVDLEAGVRITGRLINSDDTLTPGSPVVCISVSGASYLFKIEDW